MTADVLLRQGTAKLRRRPASLSDLLCSAGLGPGGVQPQKSEIQAGFRPAGGSDRRPIGLDAGSRVA